MVPASFKGDLPFSAPFRLVPFEEKSLIACLEVPPVFASFQPGGGLDESECLPSSHEPPGAPMVPGVEPARFLEREPGCRP